MRAHLFQSHHHAFITVSTASFAFRPFGSCRRGSNRGLQPGHRRVGQRSRRRRVPSPDSSSKRHAQLGRANEAALPDLLRKSLRVCACRLLVRRTPIPVADCDVRLLAASFGTGGYCSTALRSGAKARIPMDVPAGHAHPFRGLQRFDLSNQRFPLHLAKQAKPLSSGSHGRMRGRCPHRDSILKRRSLPARS
jgi:hypothetical protein